MKYLMAMTVATLAACTDPTVGINGTFGAGGFDVSPSVGGRVGNVGVTVTP